MHGFLRRRNAALRLITAVIAVSVSWRVWRMLAGRQRTNEPVEPDRFHAADRLVDETEDETFPASDPPPSWTGTPAGLSPPT